MLRLLTAAQLTAVLSLCFALAAGAQAPALQQFRDRSGLFQLDLPAGWRELAPNEARRISESPGSPAELGYVEPRLMYAVGPVDEWLAGRFGVRLQIIIQDNEWHLGDDVATELAAAWSERSPETGDLRQQVATAQRTKVGPRQHEVVTAERTTTSVSRGTETKSLDVYAPTGGRQISLAFTCPAAEFAAREPEFRRWLATLEFAKPPRGQQTLSDKLWTPIIAGAVVGLVLLLLYRYSRRRQ